MSDYNFLKNINFPSDIKKLSNSDLKTLSKEIREKMIQAVSKTGGHLGAGLGVVELTVALHYIFDTPKDKIRDIENGRRFVRFYQERGKRI